jgi:hypothetical protein
VLVVGRCLRPPTVAPTRARACRTQGIAFVHGAGRHGQRPRPPARPEGSACLRVPPRLLQGHSPRQRRYAPGSPARMHKAHTLTRSNAGEPAAAGVERARRALSRLNNTQTALARTARTDARPHKRPRCWVVASAAGGRHQLTSDCAGEHPAADAPLPPNCTRQTRADKLEHQLGRTVHSGTVCVRACLARERTAVQAARRALGHLPRNG